MGQQYSAICEQCGESFEVRKGGGMYFYLLHCDVCGKEKTVTRDEVIGADFPNKNMTEIEKVDYVAGECDCGDKKGNFKVMAPPRCPKCASIEHRIDGTKPVMMYD